jgi:flotillin
MSLAIIGIALFFLLSMVIIARRYRKVPPNMAMVVYGRGKKDAFKLIQGGGKFIIPIVETSEFISLGTHKISFDMDAITSDKVTARVQCVLDAKVSSKDDLLRKAVERFLGKQEDIRSVIEETVKGSARAIIGEMTIEALIEDRKAFAERVVKYAADDLEKLGLEIDVFTIQEVGDREFEDGRESYLDALEMKRTAQVVSESRKTRAVAEAEARTVEAAQRLAAEKAEKEAGIGIAEAQKELDVNSAKFRAMSEAEANRANQAGPLAEAEAKKAVEAERKELAKITRDKVEEELKYQEIAPAEAKATAAVAVAEGDKRATIARAEGDATRIQVTAEAEAKGNAAKMREVKVAEADGVKANKLAEAAGIQAALEAEATGKDKLAEALAKLDETGKLLLILDQAPEIVEAFAPVVGAMNEPLKSIKDVTVIGSGEAGDFFGNLATQLPMGILKAILNSGALVSAMKDNPNAAAFVELLEGAKEQMDKKSKK